MILSQLCDNNIKYYEDNSIIISNKTNYTNIKCKCCRFDIDVFNKDKNSFIRNHCDTLVHYDNLENYLNNVNNKFKPNKIDEKYEIDKEYNEFNIHFNRLKPLMIPHIIIFNFYFDDEVIRELIGNNGCYFIYITEISNVDYIWYDKDQRFLEIYGNPNNFNKTLYYIYNSIYNIIFERIYKSKYVSDYCINWVLN